MSQVYSFLDSFSRDSKFFLPLPFLWKVNIGGVSASAINTAVNKASDGWSAVNVPDEYTRDGAIQVAQEVSIPSETLVMAGAMGVPNSGGFLPGYGVQSRSDFLSRNVTVNFIETDEDLEHNYFRPWTVAVGIDGLINHDLKGTLRVEQYGNDGKLRKGYEFQDVYPTNCEGYTLNYEDSTFKIKTVTFACKNYRPI